MALQPQWNGTPSSVHDGSRAAAGSSRRISSSWTGSGLGMFQQQTSLPLILDFEPGSAGPSSHNSQNVPQHQSFLNPFNQSIQPQVNMSTDGLPSSRMLHGHPRGVHHQPSHPAYNLSPQTRCDPFDRLGDVEVGLIISLLPDADLEILRRVSRTWKRYSELFNRYSALKTRFPWAMQRLYETGGRDCANLQFRRHREKHGPGI